MPTYENKDNYLFVEITEPYSLELIMSAIHEIANRGQKENLRKVLIDARSMLGNPTILDRFKIGMEIVKSCDRQIQIASVTNPALIDRMIENTAVNRGARVRGFSDMEQAYKWLEIIAGE